MNLTVISGLSGSGKSVVLKTLEDVGFFCVDNLPSLLLPQLISWYEGQDKANRRPLAVSIDSRTPTQDFAALVRHVRRDQPQARILFLESRDDVLIRRFAETRRTHPLARSGGTLPEILRRERDLLYPLKEAAFVLDTSDLTAPQLRRRIRDWLDLPGQTLILTFKSFGYKYGIPVDSDYVFDVRVLPNPYWDDRLRELTGNDAAVRDFFVALPEVDVLIGQIESFIRCRLPQMRASLRTSVTVSLGCTGGRHRSVYVAEVLAQRFARDCSVSVRHRELNGEERS